MDNQQFPANPINPNYPPVEKKESEWKNILTIVFFVLSPLVGLILMWVLTDWSRKTKRIVTFAVGIPLIAAILGILVGIGLVSFGGGGARENARDARREADLRQMSVALDLYFANNDTYPTSLDNLVALSLISTVNDKYTNLPYEYRFQADGQDYILCADFEQKEKQKESCIDSKGNRLPK